MAERDNYKKRNVFSGRTRNSFLRFVLLLAALCILAFLWLFPFREVLNLPSENTSRDSSVTSEISTNTNDAQADSADKSTASDTQKNANNTNAGNNANASNDGKNTSSSTEKKSASSTSESSESSAESKVFLINSADKDSSDKHVISEAKTSNSDADSMQDYDSGNYDEVWASGEQIDESNPPSGYIFSASGQGALPQLKVVAPDDKNAYVKLKDCKTGKTVLEFYVRAGDTVLACVPAISCDFYYVLGNNWLGPDNLFGSEGVYAKSDKSLDFTVPTRQYTYTFDVLDANINPIVIGKKEFAA